MSLLLAVAPAWAGEIRVQVTQIAEGVTVLESDAHLGVTPGVPSTLSLPRADGGATLLELTYAESWVADEAGERQLQVTMDLQLWDQAPARRFGRAKAPTLLASPTLVCLDGQNAELSMGSADKAGETQALLSVALTPRVGG
ncbi:MAG: hypothetical protein H6740_18905 [Alphaproteobacteria bacterium]|nr:hypothetical protein [Alphaproteobacteria bacterium]